MTLPVLELKTVRNSRHPWIFTKMVRHPRPRPAPGAIVEVVDREGNFAGRGFYHPANTVAVRLLTEDPAEAVDEAFFLRLFSRARALREEILGLPKVTDAYRLVHGEADGLSGAAVDKYADVLVVEAYCAGIRTAGEWIARALQALYPGARVVFRVSEKVEQRERADFSALRKAWPAPPRVQIAENGLKMQVDLAAGHKTGYFLDQRDNRRDLAALSRGKSVWDLFCYTGGFGLSALLGGAREVTAVDLDEAALTTAKYNAKRNGLPGEGQSWRGEHRDVFEFLREAAAQGRQADVVVVDPAKLASVRAELPRGLKTTGDLNRLAARAVRPGGVLLTCSCSGLIREDQFRSVVSRAAAEAGRILQVFRETGPAPDHPVSSVFPEGRYFKALWARVFDGGVGAGPRGAETVDEAAEGEFEPGTDADGP
ncbi:MAG: class I SAM-dependent rRNA methyltransferase [Planctomycetes bacterium]|nr:class I SAM-dependent rRNA methyltransferase [Planctomycetota bacterium]